MAREPWLIDGKRFATKIKNPNFDPSEEIDSSQEDRKTGVTRECPKCSHKLRNRDLANKWPGLPAGVKFDPSDQELLGHLAAKVGVGNLKPHSFIDEFIPTLEEEDGICYTHPEKLPGVKQDGSNSHFFHRTANAYLRGNRKRRKINCGDNQNGVVLRWQKAGNIRWHKTGKTRPVENGRLRGWKKIMVLYVSNGKGEKDEKTNWVMHQYHLGTEEDEKDGEFVVSKVSYQQQSKNCDKNPTEEVEGTLVAIGDPVTPKTSTPELPRPGKWRADLDIIQEENLNYMDNPANPGKVTDFEVATHQANAIEDMPWNDLNDEADAKFDDLPWDALNDPSSLSFDSAWLAGDSQLRTDSQQLPDDLLICNENLPSSSPKEKSGTEELVSGLAEHGRIEENGDASGNTSCLDDIELDTPPEVVTFDSQFNSQESLTAWTKDI